MALRHPALPRLMGNPQEFLTSPDIRPAAMQEIQSTISSRLNGTISLMKPPCSPRYETRGSPFKPSLHHPPFLQFPSPSSIWNKIQYCHQPHAISKAPKCVRNQQCSWKASGRSSCHSFTSLPSVLSPMEQNGLFSQIVFNQMQPMLLMLLTVPSDVFLLKN